MAKKSLIILRVGRLVSWEWLRSAVSRFRMFDQKLRNLNGRRWFGFGIAATFLVVGAFVWFTLAQRVPWRRNEYSHRIPVEISRTSSKSGQGIVSLVIPRADLPSQKATTYFELQATTVDGKDVATQLAPQDPHYPLVAWLLDPASSQTGRYYLYLKTVKASPLQDSFAKPPFLLFDTFEEPWMVGWEREALTKDNAPFPWMAGLTLASRILPEDQGTGYTIEALAQQETSGPGGPAIVVANGGLAISWGRLDADHLIAQIGSNPASEVTLPVSTRVGEHFDLRVDIPRSSGAPVRFLLNGKPLLERPLPRQITGPVELFLLRRSDQGVAYFRWLGVRPYQLDEPKVKFGSTEARQAAK